MDGLWAMKSDGRQMTGKEMRARDDMAHDSVKGVL